MILLKMYKSNQTNMDLIFTMLTLKNQKILKHLIILKACLKRLNLKHKIELKLMWLNKKGQIGAKQREDEIRQKTFSIESETAVVENLRKQEILKSHAQLEKTRFQQDLIITQGKFAKIQNFIYLNINKNMYDFNKKIYIYVLINFYDKQFHNIYLHNNFVYLVNLFYRIIVLLLHSIVSFLFLIIRLFNIVYIKGQQLMDGGIIQSKSSPNQDQLFDQIYQEESQQEMINESQRIFNIQESQNQLMRLDEDFQFSSYSSQSLQQEDQQNGMGNLQQNNQDNEFDINQDLNFGLRIDVISQYIEMQNPTISLQQTCKQLTNPEIKSQTNLIKLSSKRANCMKPQKKEKGQGAKNVIKNFSRNIIRLLQKSKYFFHEQFKNSGKNYMQFIVKITKLRDKIITIADLRNLWLDPQYGVQMRRISEHYLRRKALSYIFNSNIQQRAFGYHIQCRRNLRNALRDPQSFTKLR